MTGVFSNGLGYPNNHVVRMDPTSLNGLGSNMNGDKEEKNVVSDFVSQFLHVCLLILIS
jgi:hypothetical protein